MKISLTGGIACGKSLVARYLRDLGVETIDADDIVHELIPEEERKRLAKIVFKDPKARKELEERIHPIVKRRIEEFLSKEDGKIRLAIIPLLFEVHWNEDFDIILCVASNRETQVERMMTTRGYTREEALARIDAQMDVSMKAKKSHYVILNNGSCDELKEETVRCVAWLKKELVK